MPLLEVGTEIYYTGDQANFPSFGKVVAVNPANKSYGRSVDIEYEEERFEGDTLKSRSVLLTNFNPGPGCRFMLKSEYLALRKQALAEMQARLVKINCKKED